MERSLQYAIVETQQGLKVAHYVGLATTFLQRLFGLLGRRDLALDQGLLLQPGGSVHTLTLRFAIDVLFLDEELRIVKIVHGLSPNRIALAPHSTTAVLELAPGRAHECALRPGMQLHVHAR